MREHTPPSSSASSLSDGLVNKSRKSYVDPITGRHVDETIIETTDPATGHRRRKHKRRISGAGIAGGTSSRGVEDAGYAPPPQPVYPGESISSVGSRGRSRRERYDSDTDSDSSRSVSPKKRSSSLGRAMAKLGLAGAAVGAKSKYDDFKRRRSQSRGRKSDHDANTDVSSRGSSRWSSRSRSRSKARDAALVAAGAGLANRRRKKNKSKRRGSSVSSYTSGSDSDSDHHRRSHHHRRRNSESGITKEQRERAAKAALATAAIQAIRSRKLPGGMTGEQGIRRIVEAAIASGALEVILEKRKKVDEHQRRHMIESIIGGLVSQRILEGNPAKARSQSRGALPSLERHRSRSRGPGVAEVAAGGMALYAGKQLYDKHKRSRSQQRRYDSSPERHERPRPNRKRSSSFPALLGAVGLGYGANEYRKHRSRSRSRDRRSSMRSYGNDRAIDYDRDTATNRYAVGAAAPFAYPDDPNSQSFPVAQQNGQLQPVGGQGAAVSRGAGDRDEKKSLSELSDDDPDLPEEELSKRRKHKKQRELVSAALAVLGVIGAGQKLYEGQKTHKLRKEMVIEGEMSKEEAAKKRRKAKMKEGAALGLAGLALWELYDDGKKAYDVHKDRVCFEDSCKKRHNKDGEHVDVNKRDGHPDGTRKQRKQQKQIAEGGQDQDFNDYNPNDAYASYPQAGAPGYAQGPMGVPAGGPVPAGMPAYPPPPEAAYAGIPPAGTYPVGAAPYVPVQGVRATMKDGRNMTVVYPDHVSLG